MSVYLAITLFCNAALGLRIFPIETANTVKPSLAPFFNIGNVKNVNFPLRIEQTTSQSDFFAPTPVRPNVVQTIDYMKNVPPPQLTVVKATEMPVLQEITATSILQMTKQLPEDIYHSIVPTPSLSTGEITLQFAALSAYPMTSTAEYLGAIAPTSVIKVQETFDLTS
ncbi:unnamed protein product [Danaus chrysippus]|uniref:(African queen) hypothetical protein n=1 Tax=Danaus chrysippus TaxID=151541 RepID=A0A8J2R4K5_9NEOP|nr:unnamed protein product [Danaus chrysippus]